MKPDLFYFVQLTDTHLGNRQNFKRTEAVVRCINGLGLPIAFAVHTGDIMDDNIEDDAVARAGRQVFSSLRVPIHFIPGNHDLLAGRLEATTGAYRDHFGELAYSVDYGDARCVFVNTEAFVNGADVVAVNDFEHALRSSNGRPIILFAHRPPEDALTNGGGFSGGFPTHLREPFTDTLNRYDVKAIISGHYNRDSQSWLGRVPLYVAGSVGSSGPPCFRVYLYDSGQLSYWRVEPLDRRLHVRMRKKYKKVLAGAQARFLHRENGVVDGGRSALHKHTEIE